MKPIYVDWWMDKQIKILYPSKKTRNHLYNIRWWNRYIQFSTAYNDHLNQVHFEICSDGYLMLHFEGEYDPKIADLSRYLYHKTQDDDRFVWYSNDIYELGVCRYDVFIASNKSDTFFQAVNILFTRIDAEIEKFKKEINVELQEQPYDKSAVDQLNKSEEEAGVSLVDNMSLSTIFHLNIDIPEYQRIYCWEEKNVRQLLDDITEINSVYRMGTIILHHHDGVFDLIDGQQRLVTLSLVLRRLGFNKSPLLNLQFNSDEACQYVAYNRSVIDSYINTFINHSQQELAKKLLQNIEFSVLIINSNNIDLAYTFFSNENSRGKTLTDFDLLKAHHLRYVDTEEQAEHLAKEWDTMLSIANSTFEDYLEKPYYRSLGMYVLRLRKWMYNENWDDFAPYKIKYEYEAAQIIQEIPPFGGRFHFNETIQGGAHFFAYVKQFEYRFNLFAKTAEYKAIHKLEGRTHWWFRDVIETLMFAYYLKFGEEYLSEATIGISRIILQYRYDYAKADYSRLLRQASESGILVVIDRATSPTFLIADLRRKIKTLPTIHPNLKPVARDFQRLLKNSISETIKKRVLIKDFKSYI